MFDNVFLDYDCQCKPGFIGGGRVGDCLEQDFDACRVIFTQHKGGSQIFTPCKTQDASEGCYVSDENGAFMDFRGLENLGTYSFILKYADYYANEVRTVTWEQSENPFSIKNQEATTTNVVYDLNGGDIVQTWSSSYTLFKG